MAHEHNYLLTVFNLVFLLFLYNPQIPIFIQKIFHPLVSTLFFCLNCIKQVCSISKEFTLLGGNYDHQFSCSICGMCISYSIIVIYMVTSQQQSFALQKKVHGAAKVSSVKRGQRNPKGSVASALFYPWSVLQRRHHK